MIKIICCVCGKHMGYKKDELGRTGIISHSYCEECAKKALEE